MALVIRRVPCRPLCAGMVRHPQRCSLGDAGLRQHLPTQSRRDRTRRSRDVLVSRTLFEEGAVDCGQCRGSTRDGIWLFRASIPARASAQGGVRTTCTSTETEIGSADWAGFDGLSPLTSGRAHCRSSSPCSSRSQCMAHDLRVCARDSGDHRPHESHFGWAVGNLPSGHRDLFPATNNSGCPLLLSRMFCDCFFNVVDELGAVAGADIGRLRIAPEVKPPVSA